MATGELIHGDGTRETVHFKRMIEDKFAITDQGYLVKLHLTGLTCELVSEEEPVYSLRGRHVGLKAASKILILVLGFALIFFVSNLHFGYGNVGFRIPRVFAQAIYAQQCPQPNWSPWTGWQTVNPSTGQYLQWGCIDEFGDVMIGGKAYAGAGGNIASVIAALPNCTPLPPTKGNLVTAPCGEISLGIGTFPITSGITVNGNYVRLVGAGMDNTIISCTAATCIAFNRSGSYWPANGSASVSSADGGMQDLAIEGSGSANQLGTSAIDASGLRLVNVRWINFSGSGAIGLELQNDQSGYTERTQFENLAFDNDTLDWLVTSSNSRNNSVGHNFWHQIQFILNNNQTAFKISGFAAIYSSIFDGVCNTNPPNTNTVTCIDISGSNAKFSGFLNLTIDNGGGANVTPITGNTSSNWKTWGYGLQNGAPLAVYNYGLNVDRNRSGKNSAGIAFRNCTNPTSCTAEMYEYLDGNNGISLWNGSKNSIAIDRNSGGLSQHGMTESNLSGSGLPNGTIVYCSDCTIANPCRSGGTGAFAKHLNGVWVCN